jgi:ATP-dependent Clp protease protease subunit
MLHSGHETVAGPRSDPSRPEEPAREGSMERNRREDLVPGIEEEPASTRLEDPLEDDDEEEDVDETPKREGDENRMIEKFLKARTILVSEPITSELARRIYQNLILLESDHPEKPITIIINSPGGEADTGFGMYDMIRFVQPPVRTLVAGLCASAAVMVFLAAPKESRYSLPNSRFLLHQPSTASFGQASDLEIASREILRLRDRYNEIVAKETGRKLQKVTEDSDRDFWMSAKDAQEYGLVTAVVTRREELEAKEK